MPEKTNPTKRARTPSAAKRKSAQTARKKTVSETASGAAKDNKAPSVKSKRAAPATATKKATKKTSAKTKTKKVAAKKTAPSKRTPQKKTKATKTPPGVKRASRKKTTSKVNQPSQEQKAKQQKSNNKRPRPDDDFFDEVGGTSFSFGAEGEHPFSDYQNFADYVDGVSGRSQKIMDDFFANKKPIAMMTDEKTFDPLLVGKTVQNLLDKLVTNPAAILQGQTKLWRNYAALMEATTRRFHGDEQKPIIEPKPGDKRFQHAAWQENPLLDFVKQSYLTLGDWISGSIDQIDDLSPQEKKRTQFLVDQFVNAFAPTNFAPLNPAVMDATLSSKGQNLVDGMNNLLADLERGKGILSIRQSDYDFFELGENIATTPGKVVFQNDLMQLIQYTPSTEKVTKRPLVIFPPWINKFYILDLSPKNSFIKWCVDQGRTVFVVSWVNPDVSLKDKTFTDYINEGVYAALDAIEKATGEKDVDAIGYCIGGTLLTTALALMAKRKDDRIKTATFFTAQSDFTEAGDLATFIDEELIEALERQIDANGGVLEARAMATTFNLLRPNDLIWSFVIKNYLMGEEPAKFDLLFWNADSTRMAKDVHLFYLREFYINNSLAKGALQIEGETINMTDIKIPVFLQAGETDHICPARSVYRSAQFYGGETQYMLAGSGHIAGVINPPAQGKYHHSINCELPSSFDDWKQSAERRPGSWWQYWLTWLAEHGDGKTAKPRIPGTGGLKALENAPGSYVRVKS